MTTILLFLATPITVMAASATTATPQTVTVFLNNGCRGSFTLSNPTLTNCGQNSQIIKIANNNIPNSKSVKIAVLSQDIANPGTQCQLNFKLNAQNLPSSLFADVYPTGCVSLSSYLAASKQQYQLNPSMTQQGSTFSGTIALPASPSYPCAHRSKWAPAGSNFSCDNNGVSLICGYQRTQFGPQNNVIITVASGPTYSCGNNLSAAACALCYKNNENS
ncbi:MAG TPA: hypothetical protein VI844_00145 [Coxiellaceae bacterium]|nr:hypothetical protein [Coxiellaceae bacterium]